MSIADKWARKLVGLRTRGNLSAYITVADLQALVEDSLELQRVMAARKPQQRTFADEPLPDYPYVHPAFAWKPGTGPCPRCLEPMEIGDEFPEERLCDACANVRGVVKG